MLSQAKFYGGARSYTSGTIKLPLVGERIVRVTAPTFGGGGAPEVYLPRPDKASLGGWYYLILNREDPGGENVDLYLRNGSSSIASIAPQGSAYVFLQDRNANGGDGAWLIKGTGTVVTGDQGAAGKGFNYGTAENSSGFTLDLGDANTGTAFSEASLAFGTANAVPANPSEF